MRAFNAPAILPDTDRAELLSMSGFSITARGVTAFFDLHSIAESSHWYSLGADAIVKCQYAVDVAYL